MDKEIKQLKQRVAELEARLVSLNLAERHIFEKKVQFLDGRNIQVGRTTGTKIGTDTDQKIGFYGETPVIQATAISSPAISGSDEDGIARTAIAAIITALKNIGIIA